MWLKRICCMLLYRLEFIPQEMNLYISEQDTRRHLYISEIIARVLHGLIPKYYVALCACIPNFVIRTFQCLSIDQKIIVYVMFENTGYCCPNWSRIKYSKGIYSHDEKRAAIFVFISIVQFMMNAKSQIRFGLEIVFVCLYITPSHYHHCPNFIWRHWIYKMPVRYNLSSVWARLSISSQLSLIQYVGLCVFSLPMSFVMIERIYILCLIIIIKSKVWTITHCLGLGHETMVCAVCHSIFLWICDIAGLLRGHSCPGGIFEESGPLSLTCSITTILGTLLMIDT